MPFILNNSVVCGWLFENQATAYTRTLANRLEEDRAVAPALLRLEYTNVLRTACTRGACGARTAQDMLELLARLLIDIASHAPEPAQILDLALRRQLPVATRDEALAHAARVAEVGVARNDG